MKLKKNLVIGRRLLFLILIFTISCVAHADPTPLKVGVIIALTGPAAANGVAMKNCIELARQDHPEHFRNIQFVYEDAAYEAKQAVSAFTKLRDEDKVNLVYVWGISFCKPISQLAQAARLPVICQGIEQDSYRNNPFIVRFMNSTEEYTRLLLSYIRTQKWVNIGVVASEHAYIEAMLDTLTRQANGSPHFTVLERFQVGAIDARTTVAKLRRGNFDALAVFLGPGQIGTFYKALHDQKVTVPTFGTNYFENVDDIELSNRTMDGALYVHNIVDEKFRERYQKLFGNQSQLAFGAMAYEFGTLIGDLFQADGGQLAREDILRRLETAGIRTGDAMGEYHFVRGSSGDRYFQFPIALKQIRGIDYDIAKFAEQ